MYSYTEIQFCKLKKKIIIIIIILYKINIIEKYFTIVNITKVNIIILYYYKVYNYI